MTILVRCDTCGVTVTRRKKLAPGWRVRADYDTGSGRPVFAGMAHACPSCPLDVLRSTDEDLPILTVADALEEVASAAHYAALDESELRGSARTSLVRALAILDRAKNRIAEETTA